MQFNRPENAAVSIEIKMIHLQGSAITIVPIIVYDNEFVITSYSIHYTKLYEWGRGPREILIDAQWCGNGHEYVVFDESERLLRAERISKGMGPMGHLVFSPDA